jgi:hypothetical protein
MFDAPSPTAPLPVRTASFRPLSAAPGEQLGGPSGAGRDVPLTSEPSFPIPDLPWSYEDDRFVLLVRDPRTLFTYWDFRPATVRAAFEGLEPRRLVLRVWMVGVGEPRVFRETDVALDARGYYVQGCEPNRDYRLELVVLGGGLERTLGQPTNVASLPPDGPSAWVEDRLASIPLDVPLPAASLFALGRPGTDPDRRMHLRAFDLSGGPRVPGEEEGASSRFTGESARFWSGGYDRR